MRPPARYFPVDAKPFSMRAGLIKFPTDFGNGDADARIFQIDDQLEATLAAKRAPRAIGRCFERVDTPAEAHAMDTLLRWTEARLAEEAPDRLRAADADTEATSRWDAIARALQEDLVVMHEGVEGAGRALLLHVSFPSGWRPEALIGTDFLHIHQPVPSFPGKEPEAAAAASVSMMRSMIERGPYVRFVWTVRADDALDHHPDVGGRLPWREDSAGYLRLERQLTLPFPEVGASLFIIRPYLRAFASLSAEEKAILRTAVVEMPEQFKSYKGIPNDPTLVLAALDRA